MHTYIGIHHLRAIVYRNWAELLALGSFFSSSLARFRAPLSAPWHLYSPKWIEGTCIYIYVCYMKCVPVFSYAKHIVWVPLAAPWHLNLHKRILCTWIHLVSHELYTCFCICNIYYIFFMCNMHRQNAHGKTCMFFHMHTGAARWSATFEKRVCFFICNMHRQNAHGMRWFVIFPTWWYFQCDKMSNVTISWYKVATLSRIDRNTGLFGRILFIL